MASSAGAFSQQAVQLKVISTVFLNLVKCIIVPLIFSTLVVGIASHADDMRAVGRLAFRSLVYFELLTTRAGASGWPRSIGLNPARVST